MGLACAAGPAGPAGHDSIGISNHQRRVSHFSDHRVWRYFSKPPANAAPPLAAAILRTLQQWLTLWYRMLVTPFMRRSVPRYDPQADWKSLVYALYAREGMPCDQLVADELTDLGRLAGGSGQVLASNIYFDEEFGNAEAAKNYSRIPHAHSLLMLAAVAVHHERRWSANWTTFGYDMHCIATEFRQLGSDGWYEMYCVAVLIVSHGLGSWLRSNPQLLCTTEPLYVLWGNVQAMDRRFVELCARIDR